MSSPIAERIVEVKADLGERAPTRFRFGSGLLTGAQTVLTAAHTLDGAVTVTVRISDKRELSAVLDPVWVGDPARCDLALIEVADIAAGLEFLPVALVDRETPSGTYVNGCWAIGFPAYAEVDDEQGRLVRKSVQIGGRITQLSNLDDGRLSMEISAGPHELPDGDKTLDESPWSGMSGAAVFADDHLIGLVCGHARRQGQSAITVTPLSFLSGAECLRGNPGEGWSRLGVADPAALPMIPARPGALDHTTAARPASHVPQNLNHSVKRGRGSGQARDTDREGDGAPSSVDVFLSYPHAHRQQVEELAKSLEDEHGLAVWLDRWILIPGTPWQPEMARGLEEARSCAVCLGSDTPTGWFRNEIRKALNRQAQNPSFRVIPVLLPGADNAVVDEFLELNTWVDLGSKEDPAYALHLLTSGIRGVAPGRWPPQPQENSQAETVGNKLRQLEQWKSRLELQVLIETQQKLLDRWIDDE